MQSRQEKGNFLVARGPEITEKSVKNILKDEFPDIKDNCVEKVQIFTKPEAKTELCKITFKSISPVQKKNILSSNFMIQN